MGTKSQAIAFYQRGPAPISPKTTRALQRIVRSASERRSISNSAPTSKRGRPAIAAWRPMLTPRERASRCLEESPQARDSSHATQPDAAALVPETQRHVPLADLARKALEVRVEEHDLEGLVECEECLSGWSSSPQRFQVQMATVTRVAYVPPLTC